jgi:hypothetical protein
MVTVKGRDYGTADEIAQSLGPDVTPTTVRRWADRHELPVVCLPGRGGGEVLFPLDRAAQIEHDTRNSPLGRPRPHDTLRFLR